jgi:hypothetical protein
MITAGRRHKERTSQWQLPATRPAAHHGGNAGRCRVSAGLASCTSGSSQASTTCWKRAIDLLPGDRPARGGGRGPAECGPRPSSRVWRCVRPADRRRRRPHRLHHRVQPAGMVRWATDREPWLLVTAPKLPRTPQVGGERLRQAEAGCRDLPHDLGTGWTVRLSVSRSRCRAPVECRGCRGEVVGVVQGLGEQTPDVVVFGRVVDEGAFRQPLTRRVFSRSLPANLRQSGSPWSQLISDVAQSTAVVASVARQVARAALPPVRNALR